SFKAFAADILPAWKTFNSNESPDTVITLFGPPSVIRTEERYQDWLINKATGCGQLKTYGMVYSIATGALNSSWATWGGYRNNRYH
ncbi:MAG: hypothetical protein M0Z52_02485, partial [Actinomycetota bacterium]|nr:hypothetical protein [Actinomycetota bacterium]